MGYLPRRPPPYNPGMDTDSGVIKSNLIDLDRRCIYAASVRWNEGRITSVAVLGPADPTLDYLLPGLVDAHLHIESTMLPPAEFGRMAARHGTVAAVTDPHEIANILGLEGVHYMAEDARHSPIRLFCGAPACVPATQYETAGAELTARHVQRLLDEGSAGHLAEVMDFPAVLERAPEIMAKIDIARTRGRRVDGHAPGLTGDAAARYASAGVDNDHECATLEEARDKLNAGQWIAIREGSAARSFEALHPLIASHPQRLMFCTDDLHPDDLARGHIDRIARRAIAAGHDPFDVLRIACTNPVRHYALPIGQLRVGERMDAISVDDPARLNVLTTWSGGVRVASRSVSESPHRPSSRINRFNARTLTAGTLHEALPTGNPDDPALTIRVINCRDGALDTHETRHPPCWSGNRAVPDPEADILMLAVLNRYRPTRPAAAFIKGFGLRDGAIAGSIAHDSHNVIAVGTSATRVAEAINQVVDMGGGIAATGARTGDALPLPIAGLMSDADGDTVARRHEALVSQARALGTPLQAPFMTLSFMALLVIPALKLSDRGLFDGERFALVPVLTH